ncbi:hypothetical protein ABTY96_47870 [Streptomyces sp. NPDC096057]|uniref:hypothetical protein n=1 Tax=Streptomyces sp. NPDC096057 TaxID=3155543 RepID=UPI00332F732B
MTPPTHGHTVRLLGPDTPLAQVFAFFEADGHAGPAAAWHAFTGTWNWAAPLATAVPRVGLPGPVARPVPGGYALSGHWRLPSHDGTGTWLALPLADRTGRTDGTGGADLFVVSSKVLPGAVRGLPADGGEQEPEPGFRLENAHVPAGFVTRATGEPLRAGDAAFLWTAVTALALGAARRTTDLLAGPASQGGAGRGAVTAAELAAVLHDERQSLAALLHGAPSVRQGLAPSVEELLMARVESGAAAVLHVVTAAYEWALASDPGAARHPLVRMAEDSAPILQQVRFAGQLLPRDDMRSRQKGRTR